MYTYIIFNNKHTHTTHTHAHTHKHTIIHPHGRLSLHGGTRGGERGDGEELLIEGVPVCVCVCEYVCMHVLNSQISIYLSISYIHTHTHTHTHLPLNELPEAGEGPVGQSCDFGVAEVDLHLLVVEAVEGNALCVCVCVCVCVCECGWVGG